MTRPRGLHSPGWPHLRTVRIFLSSPGDVAAERAQARDLLLGLARGPFVRGRVHIDVVSWDDPHAPAHDGRAAHAAAGRRPQPADARRVRPHGGAAVGPDGHAAHREEGRRHAVSLRHRVGVRERPQRRQAGAACIGDPRRCCSTRTTRSSTRSSTQKRRVDAFFAQLHRAKAARFSERTPPTPRPTTCSRVSGRTSSAYLSEVLRRSGRRHGAASAARRRERSNGTQASAARPPDVPVAYREWVKKQHGGVDLLGLQLKKGRPPSLSAIYVPQTTTAARPPTSTAGRRRRPGTRRRHARPRA